MQNPHYKVSHILAEKVEAPCDGAHHGATLLCHMQYPFQIKGNDYVDHTVKLCMNAALEYNSLTQPC